MTETPKTNVQKLQSLFTGKSTGNGADTAASSGAAASAVALVDTNQPQPNKRGRSEGKEAANTPFTKLDLLDLLDEQEVNYKKNTEVSIADALGTFGKSSKQLPRVTQKNSWVSFMINWIVDFNVLRLGLTKLKLQQ